MKRIVLAVVVVLFCLGLSAEPISADESGSSFRPWTFTGGLTPSLGTICTPGKNIDSWRPKITVDAEVRAGYQLNDKWELQSGISWHRFNAKARYNHPEPYVINTMLWVHNNNLRLPLGLNWYFHQHEPAKYYLGLGTYLDWNYESKLTSQKVYASDIIIDYRDIQSVVGTVVPGLQLQLGIKSYKSRLELRYWLDLDSFKFPETGDDVLRRNKIQLGFGFDFLNL